MMSDVPALSRFCLAAFVTAILMSCASQPILTSKVPPAVQEPKRDLSPLRIRDRPMVELPGIGGIYADKQEPAADGQMHLSGRVFVDATDVEASDARFAYAEDASWNPVAKTLTMRGTWILEWEKRRVIQSKDPGSRTTWHVDGTHTTKGQHEVLLGD